LAGSFRCPFIPQGRINNGYRQTALISGAACSGPATLTLKAEPMRMFSQGQPSPAFKTTINFQATARFGSAQTTLATTTSAQSSVNVPAGYGQSCPWRVLRAT
jgi:hypothetical protein